MQNQALLTILVGGTAGIVAAVTTSLVMTPSEAVESQTVATPSAEVAGLDSVSREELELKFDQLRMQNTSLAQRLQDLEQGRVAWENRRREVEPAAMAEVSNPDDDLRDALAALSNPDGSLPAGLTEGMRQAFQTFREEEQAESNQRWEEARLAELANKISKYTTELNLDEYQSKELGALLTSEHERQGLAIETARENGTWDTVREEMRTIRDETREGLKLVLTPEQYDQYREDDRGRGRGRDRGADDGGGGRGGPR